MAKKKETAKETTSEAKASEDVSALEFTLNKQKYTIGVKSFLYKGKKYDSETAVKDHKDVLKELVDANSFILKKK